eukprot:1793652-Amphidinium_carterae.1
MNACGIAVSSRCGGGRTRHIASHVSFTGQADWLCQNVGNIMLTPHTPKWRATDVPNETLQTESVPSLQLGMATQRP